MGDDPLAQVARSVDWPMGEREGRSAAGGLGALEEQVWRRDDEDAVVAASVDDLASVGLPVAIEDDLVRIRDERRAARVRDADGRPGEHHVCSAADAVLASPARVARLEMKLPQAEEPALEDQARRLSHAWLYDGRRR